MTDDLTASVMMWSLVYVLLLLLMGVAGRLARRERSLSDHFLAGRGLGTGVLFLTLFATQYSGNSLVAFPAKTYREGLVYVMNVTIMAAIITGYSFFVPRFRAMSKNRGWITPGDWLAYRWPSRGIHGLATGVFLLTLVNYLLAQLMALGNAVEGISAGSLSYETGVIGGAAIILVCEWLGGMRTVAWTDALQGLLLLIGLGFILILLTEVVGSPREVLHQVASSDAVKVAPPDAGTAKTWLSTLVLFMCAAPLYPQALQRVFAARTDRSLKISMMIMSFLPLFAISAVVWIGICGIAMFPDLPRADSEGITFLVLRRLVELQPESLVGVVIVMMSVSAAIMSTADSSLLSLGSLVTRDVVGRLKGETVSVTNQRTGTAHVTSLVVMGVMVAVALLRPETLWVILIFKFGVLAQLSPAFLIGCWNHEPGQGRISVDAVTAGLVTGLIVVVGGYLSGHRQVGGFDVGLCALVFNAIVVFLYPSRRRSGVSV